MTGTRPPLELRIHAEGELSDALVDELGGLTVQGVPGGVVLQGPVVDTAALWGVLHRLRRAGLVLRSVERLGPQLPPGASAPSHPCPGPDDQVVRIEVEGHAAGVVSMAVGSADVFQSPPSTTLVMRLTGDDALFDVLDVLEDLALDLRGIRFDD